jgi:hypothetical protein
MLNENFIFFDKTCDGAEFEGVFGGASFLACVVLCFEDCFCGQKISGAKYNFFFENFWVIRGSL